MKGCIAWYLRAAKETWTYPPMFLFFVLLPIVSRDLRGIHWEMEDILMTGFIWGILPVVAKFFRDYHREDESQVTNTA